MVRPIGDIPAEVPTEVRARFASAEARLYPLALADPDGYERVASVIGVVADELRRAAADVAAVLEHREELVGRRCGSGSRWTAPRRGGRRRLGAALPGARRERAHRVVRRLTSCANLF
jgi:hypothetical protein